MSYWPIMQIKAVINISVENTSTKLYLLYLSFKLNTFHI